MAGLSIDTETLYWGSTCVRNHVCLVSELRTHAPGGLAHRDQAVTCPVAWARLLFLVLLCAAQLPVSSVTWFSVTWKLNQQQVQKLQRWWLQLPVSLEVSEGIDDSLVGCRVPF